MFAVRMCSVVAVSTSRLYLPALPACFFPVVVWPRVYAYVVGTISFYQHSAPWAKGECRGTSGPDVSRAMCIDI